MLISYILTRPASLADSQCRCITVITTIESWSIKWKTSPEILYSKEGKGIIQSSLGQYINASIILIWYDDKVITNVLGLRRHRMQDQPVKCWMKSWEDQLQRKRMKYCRDTIITSPMESMLIKWPIWNHLGWSMYSNSYQTTTNSDNQISSRNSLPKSEKIT